MMRQEGHQNKRGNNTEIRIKTRKLDTEDKTQGQESREMNGNIKGMNKQIN